MDALTTTPTVRLAIDLRGTVQGVGFRPAMYRLARRLDVVGFVRNEPGGVRVEIEGAPDAVARFVAEIPRAAPARACIETVRAAPVPTRGELRFEIAASDAAGAGATPAGPATPPDGAPCDACLRELADPRDRRYRYPFINCTACGPRFTIVRDVPYDRARTTMDAFPLCAACAREYHDPADRRFHAEPNACPACGPRVTLVAPGEADAAGEAALAGAVRALRDGRVVAVKAAGGFALAVDATNEPAVARLRARKRRPHKPFAVMARDLAHAERVAVLSDAARAALLSPARPIVLAPLRAGAGLAPSVAPGLALIGVFLPPTPLQHLLLADGPALQVMTSGNAADEPIVTRDDGARARLAGIADAFLLHDREIHAAADDSVVRAVGAGVVAVRRGRGLVPEPLALPNATRPVLAVGGHAKSTVALAHDGRVVGSQHLGDLDHPDAYALYCDAVAHLVRLAGVRPELVAHDRHPDYRSTRWARASGLPCVAVQHHHAHVAACLVEHGRAEAVIGVAFDGTGYGDGGALWGGEILLADLAGFERAGHLRALALAGGEAAVHAPWRLALAALLDAGEPLDLLARVEPRRLRAVRALLERDVAAPRAHGAGRWFDAVAALCGVRAEVSYDGQAAVELESLAAPGPAAPFEFGLAHATPGDPPFDVDLRPTVRQLAGELRRGTAAAVVAARFHETMAAVVVASCRRVRDARGVATAVLTGGCFQNRRLLDRTRALLAREGFEVLTHRRVPPNDAGLAVGQAAVACAQTR